MTQILRLLVSQSLPTIVDPGLKQFQLAVTKITRKQGSGENIK